jgi:TonB family protein
MKKVCYPVIILVLLLILPSWLSAQDQADTLEYEPTSLELHDIAKTGFIPDTLAKYPGGVYGIKLHIQKNIRYPLSAAMSKRGGRIMLSFSVDTTGTTGDFVILRSGGKQLDQEAIRLIQIMEEWKPAVKNGLPVKSYYWQIVSFHSLGIINR